jgi:hypothetical protein
MRPMASRAGCMAVDGLAGLALRSGPRVLVRRWWRSHAASKAGTLTWAGATLRRWLGTVARHCSVVDLDGAVP